MKLPAVTFGERPLKIAKPYLAGTDVRRLQQALKELGFYDESVDGIYGKITDKAFKRFKKYLGEERDERVFEILKIYQDYGIGSWKTVRGDFSNAGHIPFIIPDKLNSLFYKNIKDIKAITAYKNRIFVTCENILICIDAKTGRVLWYNNEINPRYPITATCDCLIVPDEGITVIDPYRGKVLEKIKLEHPACGSPVYFKGKIIFADEKGKISAVIQKKGTVWEFNPGGIFTTPPAVYDYNLFFASYDRNVYCLDMMGGVLWETKISDYINEPLFIQDTHVFALGDGRLFAFNRFSGENLWFKALPEKDFSSYCLGRGKVYILSKKGNLYILNKDDGDFSGVETLPIEPGGLLFGNDEKLLTGSKGGLFVYKISENGVTLKEKYLEGHEIRAVAFTGRCLFVATKEGLFVLS